jgi:hypothetical protein
MNYPPINLPNYQSQNNSDVLKALAGLCGLVSANVIAHEILRLHPEIDILLPALFASASMTYILTDGGFVNVAIVTGVFYLLYQAFVKKQRYINPRKTTTTTIPPQLRLPKITEQNNKDNVVPELTSIGTLAADMAYGAFLG